MRGSGRFRGLVHALGRGLRRWQNVLAGLALLAAVLVGCRLWPHPPLRDWLPESTAVYDAHGRLLRLTLASDGQYRLWTPLEKMSPSLIKATLLHEDQWFHWHPGFNPYGLMRGAWVTYVQHGHPQGGSTVTMQLARLMGHMHTRTPLGKLRQIARAVELELFYSKHDILEAYLNFAPYGGNVQGAGAASLVWFDTPVDQLTLPEALTLAVLPQDPSSRSGDAVGQGGDTVINHELRDARDQLYRQWIAEHPRDARLKPLFALPLRLRPVTALPFEAPHAVRQALATQRERGHSVARLRTTIDLDLQHVLEDQVHDYVERRSSSGIGNAAALLVDTRDMGIKAMVGSADFFDDAIDGQVNGTLARRSPGSTLKPFLYALGFDQGVLHPQTVLRDVPTAFGPYAPENFDGRFEGPVTATQALIRSRNIPAVWVASQLHDPDLYGFLRESGVRDMASRRHYGLALVLGGGEVTMQELARMYAVLPNRGMLRPLRLLQGDAPVAGKRVLSDAASFMVLDMLRQNPRPDSVEGGQNEDLPVYWKTGTSWAFRDAWTAGSFGPYVLVVWVGNFDGRGNPALVGAQAAAPLFFRIVDAVRAGHPHLREPYTAIPDTVRRVRICLASGELPSAWCPQTGTTWFIPGVSPIRVDDIYRPVVIDDATGRPACPPYDGKHTHVQVYAYWPSDMQHVFAQAGMPRRTPPRNPQCADAGAEQGSPPSITSPLRGSVYTLRLKHAEHDDIAFMATSDADADALFWFVDQAYVGRTKPGKPLMWRPRAAGSHVVRVVDDHGRASRRTLTVSLTD